MAVQGLFTQGPSVDDILAKRNKSQFDLQQQLMNQAAQGARDPAKMRAVSLLGSSLGRALGGAMGGQDEELEKLKATEAKRQELAGQYGEVVGRGTPEQRLAFGNTLIQNNMGDRGAAIVLQARKDIEEEQQKAEDQLMIDIDANDAAILKEKQFNDLQTRNYNMGQQLKEYAPDLASLLMSGQSTDKHEVAGLAALAEKRKAAEAIK